MGIVQRTSCTVILCASSGAAFAYGLVFEPLDQPCRLLDTRTSQGGPGKLTSTHGNYTLGVSDADIGSSLQNGNSAGCGIPSTALAVSVSINQFNATNSGNVTTWSTDKGTTPPTAGTAVYNPSVATPSPGQVLYNPGSVTIQVSATTQQFFLKVANGQLDMTINLVGYWRATEQGSQIYGLNSQSLGEGNVTGGEAAIAIGIGNDVEGAPAIALGRMNSVVADNAIAIGYNNINRAQNSITMGFYGYAQPDSVNSFVFNDGSVPQAGPTVGHQFWVRATNGAAFYSSANLQSGVWLQAGAGTWTALSDRNAKTAVQRIDGRDVLDRVVAMPLATWQYKTQDAKYRHMGPMAQDFYAAFGLGESDTGIDTIDADGVALAAIQGLNAKLERESAEKDQRIAKLEAQMAELAAAIKHPAGAASP